MHQVKVRLEARDNVNVARSKHDFGDLSLPEKWGAALVAPS